MEKNYHVITFISKYLILRKLIVADFADIIKIATIFVKTIFKDSKKICIIMQSTSVFLKTKKVADFR